MTAPSPLQLVMQHAWVNQTKTLLAAKRLNIKRIIVLAVVFIATAPERAAHR